MVSGNAYKKQQIFAKIQFSIGKRMEVSIYYSCTNCDLKEIFCWWMFRSENIPRNLWIWCSAFMLFDEIKIVDSRNIPTLADESCSQSIISIAFNWNFTKFTAFDLILLWIRKHLKLLLKFTLHMMHSSISFRSIQFVW